ncbi:MAG: extensin family protein [Roseovarius sp.]
MKHLFKALLAVAFIVCGAAVFHPDTPLPDEWNPTKSLQVTAPLTPLTKWKLRAALGNDAQCLMVMKAAGQITALSPLEDSDQCFISPRIRLGSVGQAKMRPVDTRCQTALRMAMWEAHGLQTAAIRHLGVPIAEIRHFSSYSCRQMRTSSGGATRMSTHATANAIDVSGFVTRDGRTLDLKQHWPQIGPKADFLRDAFQSACLWFPVALGPEFNALHADHFHLQTTGWGLCR